MTEHIVIVGIGGLFPNARNLDEFWHNILNAKDTAIHVDVNRWHLNPDDIYSSSLSPDKVNSRHACLIQNFEFDPNGFNVNPDLLCRLDPMYQILLHAGRDAWNDAKTESLNKARVGIVIGNIVLPTEFSSLFSDEIFKQLFETQLFGKSQNNPVKTESLNRYVAGLPGTLLAKALGLGAGAYTLDAACSSSLYSLKYAMDELLSGRCDAMLAGGVSRPDCLYTQMGFSQLNAISRSGRCSPFDRKADGLVVGEGAGIFVLKRLSDAIEQNDYIYGLIKGIGLSNDIQGNIMSPDTEGQLRAMKSAYAAADWSVNQVQHIECHGTGTPVGDVIEFNSLKTLWQDHNVAGECVIGSVKSNIGHLLTAAGAAALMKTLLAMKHGILPPTANFEAPSNKIDLINSPFRILSKAEIWDVNDKEPRCAAISGFGFGGINAHVLLQEYDQKDITSITAASSINLRMPFSDSHISYSPEDYPLSIHTSSKANDIAEKDIAIVGMDTRLGPWHNQDEFNEAIFFGPNKQSDYPRNWWGIDSKNIKGYLMKEVEIPLGRYRIPPAELKEMLPQQLLMLDVASNALNDAGLSVLSKTQQLRTGVFIGITLDLNTTNFHFRWMQQKYALEWLQRLGITLSHSELNEWIDSLRKSCGPALSANRTMGALGGIVASRIARAFHIGGPAFTVSSEETSGLRALELGVRALQQNELDQVVIGAVDLAGDPRAVWEHVFNKHIHTVADGATAFILKRYKDAINDDNQIYALVKGIGSASSQVKAIYDTCSDSQCTLDSIDLVCAAAQEVTDTIPGLEQAVNHYFSLGHTGAANGLMAVSNAVSVLHHKILPKDQKKQACYWLKDRIDGARRSLVNSNSIAGDHVSVILQEGHSKPKLRHGNKKLFGLSATDRQRLIEKINNLSFDNGISQYKDNEIFRVALLVSNENEFNIACKEIIMALKQNVSINNGRCFYTINPLYKGDNLAFVYPGSGNHFYGMGQEFGIAFPQVLEKLNHENDHFASQFANGRFWQADEHDEFSHQEVIFGQVWLGTFVSDVMTSFGIKPDAIIGYSLGETAGFFSTRTWIARDEMLQRIKQSSLFTEELAGPCRSVQKVWNTIEPIDWSMGVVNAHSDHVKAVLKRYKHVYLLIINTPNECVIGGDRVELHDALEKLKAKFHSLSGVTTVHCEVAKPVAKAYRDLHLFDTTPPEGITFYSGIHGGAYHVTRETAANSILDQALTSFDYTKVINSAYKDGIRLFIEIGPGSSCTRMISQILDDKPHFVKALCVKNQNGIDNLMQVLARLFAEGISINLSQLQETKAKTNYEKYINIKIGEQPFKIPLPPGIKTALTGLNRYQTYPEIISSDKTGFQSIIERIQQTELAKSEAQETFLRVNQGMTETLAQAINIQMQLLNNDQQLPMAVASETSKAQIKEKPVYRFNRDMCLEFAIGSIGRVLGSRFAHIDQYPTRVRLPDEPLMLVDRIIDITGEPHSMTYGRIVTEHDVLSDAWYLDLEHVPTCIVVEAGQADLFLSAYLGIDHMTKGRAVYRLLDACITFHNALPRAGQTIRYDICIDHFFRQGDTWLFHFNFEGTVNGQPLLSMTHGCAGFFTEQELVSGQGIVLTNMEKRADKGVLTGDYQVLVSMNVEHYDDDRLNALRNGDLPSCFGDNFSDLGLKDAIGLPGGRMTLVHRILKLDPTAGRYGLGQITGEADIHPDDWFLTCHFIDDKVMPGTLMYECCLHTLRVYLLRMGWVGEHGEFSYEPILGEVSQLKCRGQVIRTTRTVQYEITLKEIGYKKDGMPYVLADALMYADHRAIVQIKNMSVQLNGLKRDRLVALWQHKNIKTKKQIFFDKDSILAFATGNPSEAFGDKYKLFDRERKIARLPGPPYQFLDCITSIRNCMQWVLKAGGIIEAEYDVPTDAWYFTEDNQPYMPFSILLEVALQPCGWLAAYLGSALTSEIDLSFRNLGGKATQYMRVTPDIGPLTTKIKINHVSQSGGMIIQHFDYDMVCNQGLVYKGDTYFGFFSKQALANQIGIREADLYIPTKEENKRGIAFSYPNKTPMPNTMMRMVDEITLYVPDGGSNGLGYIEGTAQVKKDAWFFKAHFYQDPVWPGSLGLESFQQLLKIFSWKRWKNKLQAGQFTFESMLLNQQHEWIYRGQILPSNNRVTIQAVIKQLDDATRTVIADGFLSVDNKVIYQMKDFALRII